MNQACTSTGRHSRRQGLTYGVEVQLVLALHRRLLLCGQRGVEGVDLAGCPVDHDLFKAGVARAAQAVHEAASGLQQAGPQAADPLASVANAADTLLEQRTVVIGCVVVPDPGFAAQVCCGPCECPVWQLLALLVRKATRLPVDCLANDVCICPSAPETKTGCVIMTHREAEG